MGAAVRQRGDKLIRQLLQDEARPVEFVLMDRLNSIPKNLDAGTPLSNTKVFLGKVGGRDFWLIEDQKGFGFWYLELSELMKRWHIQLISYDAITGVYEAMSVDHQVSTDELRLRCKTW